MLVAVAAVLTASAQAVESHKFLDNWSVGVYGGAVSPTTQNPFKHSRGVAGLELTKNLTPVFGWGIQASAGFNTTGAKTAVDNVTTMLIGKVNFSNWFCGYNGKPRFFEVEGLAGIGYNHYAAVSDEYAITNGAACSSLASKFGLNFNFNLGEKKAWTISLRPAIAYDLEGGEGLTDVQYNVNNSVLELTAGVVYHFKNSNGEHYFTKVRPYDQAEVDALNAKINDLRAAAAEKDKALADKEAELRRTQQMLNDCRNQKPVVERVVDTKTEKSMESVVTFRQGKSTIDNSQLPNVERIATYMRNHADAKVVIKGYASPEGSIEVNTRLANERAAAVRTMLINKYKISADRISAEGQGVGNMFSEPDWNRVSICTIDEGK